MSDKIDEQLEDKPQEAGGRGQTKPKPKPDPEPNPKFRNEKE